MTNAEYIRSLPTEVMAMWLCDLLFPECPLCPADCDGWSVNGYSKMIDWLKQEVDDDSN